MNARELRAKRSQILQEARNLVDKAEAENRDFSADEQTEYDAKITEAKALDNRIARLESLPGNLPTAPAINRTGLGDSEQKAFSHYFRTGDDGGIRSLRGLDEHGATEYKLRIPTPRELRATDEIVTTAATEGGPAIPTGFVNQIAARKGEVMLADRLGVQRIPGVGTTVNHAYENADPAVFAATSEQVDALSNTYERDRFTLATKAFTLTKKTKKLVLTEEVLADEDANLMGFIADHIGRALGLTHNTALITEVAANGTALKTFASASAIAVGEPEDLVFHATLSYYLDDGGSIGWVMRPATFGAIKKLTGDARMYDNGLGAARGKVLMEYPVLYSGYPGAITASGKSLYFGNWYYVGMREDPALSFIRDPYTTDGVVILKYATRLVYGVLIAGAVGYGAHPTA